MADWVIVVDDDTENLKIAGNILSKNGMRVTALRSGKSFLEYIEEHDMPDLVLLDIRMPNMDGFDTLVNMRRFEEKESLKPTPVIFLTADDDRGSEMRGFQMGVSDFIHKPFDPGVFVQRVSNVINSRKKMISIEEKASHDYLTGFYNKESIHEMLVPVCQKQSGSLCIIDLDSFKLVNDIYGHEMGDRVLEAFSGILSRNLTEGSICGRIGGDEFLVFVRNMQRESDIDKFTAALNIGIVKACEELVGGDMRIPLGASVGAVSVPKHGTQLDELFSLADKSLYAAKDKGKHGYVLYKEDLGIREEEDTTIVDLKTLSKLLEERNVSQSVMWMGREAFGNVYRYMMRYLDRYDISAYKVLFTINIKEDKLQKDIGEKIATAFREIIQTTLRNSDVMVRVGMDQFFLLLPEMNPEHIERVLNRMKLAWRKSSYYEITELEIEYDRIGGDSNVKAGEEDLNTVVVVDDEKSNILIAEHILKREGISTVGLKSGEELLKYLEEKDPALLLIDIGLGDMDGFEVRQRLIAKGGRISRIPVIFLTDRLDDQTEVKGFAMGALDFIRKPFVPELLTVRVKHALSLIRLQKS
ncbi:MAG: response regulator [Lachnospiraceae bacterium]|nr:response regulator [Lachnospiraceae bacterium]